EARAWPIDDDARLKAAAAAEGIARADEADADRHRVRARLRARRAAAAAGLHHGQTVLERRAHGGTLVDVAIQDVDFPVDAVRLLDPELVLVGMTTVHAHLLAHRQARRPHPRNLAHHDRHQLH